MSTAREDQRTTTRSWPSAVAFCACAFYLYVASTLLAWALVPAVFGLRPTVIVSDSMRPAISGGDVVLTGPASDSLRPGDVVTFEDPAHPGRLLTHRVVSVDSDGRYRTRGDANGALDSTPTSAEAVVGVGRLLVPAAGLPLVWLRDGQWLAFAGWGVTTAMAGYLLRRCLRPVLPTTWSIGLEEPPPQKRRRAKPRAGSVPAAAPVWSHTLVVVVVGLATVFAVAPRTTMSAAAFTARTDNPTNSLAADTLQPATGFSVAQECTASPNVSVVSTATGFGNGTTYTIARPSGVVAGDVLLAQVVLRPDAALTAPADWNLIRKDGTTISSSLYWKTATASEPADYSWTSPTSIRWSGGISAWRNAATTTPVVASSGTADTGTSIVAPSVTTTAPNQTLVGFFSQQHSGGVTPPATMNELWDVASQTGGDPTVQAGASSAYQTVAAAGATGTRTATGLNAYNVGQLLVLNRRPNDVDVRAQWTPTTSTYATGYTLSRTGTSYDVTPRTANTYVDSAAGPSTTYNYNLVARSATWTSVAATASVTTSGSCG